MLQLSDSDLIRSAVLKAPVSRSVVSRYVAGESVDEAVAVAAELRTTNRLATLDYLGEDTTDRARAEATRDTYVHLLEALAEADLAAYGAAEVSVKLSAVGQALPQDGDAIALENARAICEAAARAGTTVTLDMEDHTTTDRTLEAAARAARGLPVGRRRRSSPTCTAPRPTAATSPARAAGCGCARAPTRSPRRSPSRTATTSTCRTCAASRC